MTHAVLAQDDACGDQKFSKKLDSAIKSIQKARDAKKWDEVLAKSREADANNAEKSPYEQFWLHEFQGVALANLKQYPESLVELEAAYSSPCMAEGEKPTRETLLMQLAYQTKQYPKAIGYAKHIWETTGDMEAGNYLANAYYITDDFANTRDTMRKVIARIEEGGGKPDEQTLRIMQSACLNLKDDTCVVELAEKLVALYPNPKYWEDLTYSLMRDTTNDREMLNILRLADGVHIMREGSQFIEMAQLSIAQGLPGEAQNILQKGFEKKVFTLARERDHATRLMADAKTAAELDQSTLDKQDASARAKATGDSDVKLGAAYLSYGENAKAIEALQRGLGKGGVKNPDEASMLLGIAYLRSDNKAEAAKAFKTVNKTPGMARIAKFWLLNTGGGAAT